MAYSSLSDFVKDLEQAGELKRIKAEVAPDLEITQITDRVSKAEGPALLFEKVEGSDMPLLINAFGSYVGGWRWHSALKIWTRSPMKLKT